MIQKKANSNDKLRVFCFSYAGGGASVFRNWQDYFGEGIGIYPIQLPGRENLISEKPIDDIKELLKELSNELYQYKDVDCIFFGHSLGGRIAYAAASQMQKNMHIKSLIISASPAPNCIVKKVSALNEKEFIDELVRLEGTPKEIIENKEIINLFMPMLRADYKLDDSVDYTAFDKVKCKIWGIYGRKDKEVDESEVRMWKDFTYDSFEIKSIDGGHFFIREERDSLLKYMKQILESYI